MSRPELQVDLERQLAPDVYTKVCPIAQRMLLLQDLSHDLQFGLVVHKIEKHGKTFHMVDLGVRIPSVESVYDEYEEHAMRVMGFPDPTPIGWLTFWTALKSPTGYKGSCDDPALIVSEFHRLRDEVRRDLKTSEDHYQQLLGQCSLPAWATMPGSSFLVIRTLVCCPQKRSDVETVMRSCSDTAGYETNVYEFLEWFEQRIA